MSENEETILDEYLKPRLQQPKFWRWVILTVIFILLVYIYKATVIDPTVQPEELKASQSPADVISIKEEGAVQSANRIGEVGSFGKIIRKTPDSRD